MELFRVLWRNTFQELLVRYRNCSLLKKLTGSWTSHVCKENRSYSSMLDSQVITWLLVLFFIKQASNIAGIDKRFPILFPITYLSTFATRHSKNRLNVLNGPCKTVLNKEFSVMFNNPWKSFIYPYDILIAIFI